MVRQCRRALLPLFAILPGLGLGACATDSAQPLQQQSSPAVSLAPPMLSTVPYVPSTPTGPDQRRIDPSELVGLKAGVIQAKFGAPTLLRRDGPAQIWQYRSSGCIVDVFFYRTPAQDDEVTYVDLRGPKAEAGQGPVCLGSLGEPPKQAAALR